MAFLSEMKTDRSAIILAAREMSCLKTLAFRIKEDQD